MSRLVALFFVLATTTGLELDLSKFKEPAANGSSSFIYFSPKTEAAAEALQQYGKDVDIGLAEYTDALKEENNASSALERYNEAVESVEGTTCAVSEESKNELSGAQIVIEDIIKTCAENVPAEERAALDKEIAENLEKVQAIDNSVRLNSHLCFSLRVPPPSSCVEANKKALARLDDVMSYSEKAKLSFYTRSTYFASKESIDACVQSATSPLQEDLKTRVEEIDRCQLTLQ